MDSLAPAIQRPATASRRRLPAGVVAEPAAGQTPDMSPLPVVHETLSTSATIIQVPQLP